GGCGGNRAVCVFSLQAHVLVFDREDDAGRKSRCLILRQRRRLRLSLCLVRDRLRVGRLGDIREIAVLAGAGECDWATAVKLRCEPASAASFGAGVTSGCQSSSEEPEPGVAGAAGVSGVGSPVPASGVAEPSTGAAGAGTLCSTAGGVTSGWGLDRKRL